MNFSRSCAAVACATMIVGAAVPAAAQEDKCRDAAYNIARKVLDQEQRNNRKVCTKGISGDQDACIAAEASSAEAQEAKLESLFQPGKKCETVPASGLVTASIPLGDDIGDTMQAASDTIARRIFGAPYDELDGSKCQDMIIKRAGRQAVAIAKAFRLCADGSVDPACIDAAIGYSKVHFQVLKLVDELAAHCDLTSGHAPGAGDGSCAGTGSLFFGYCVGDVVDCEMCRALNTIAGFSQDCDLLDDAMANASCSP